MSDNKQTKKVSTQKGTAKKKSSKNRKRMILIALEALVIVVALLVAVVIYVMDKKGGNENAGEGVSATVKKENLIVKEENKVDGFWNIALFGVDSRTGLLGKGTLSDCIIVCSINKETKEVKLVSVYRDTYLNIGNDTYNKANSAYSTGGPEQAINMLNTNLDLDITSFATVDAFCPIAT